MTQFQRKHKKPGPLLLVYFMLCALFPAVRLSIGFSPMYLNFLPFFSSLSFHLPLLASSASPFFSKLPLSTLPLSPPHPFLLTFSTNPSTVVFSAPHSFITALFSTNFRQHLYPIQSHPLQLSATRFQQHPLLQHPPSAPFILCIPPPPKYRVA